MDAEVKELIVQGRQQQMDCLGMSKYCPNTWMKRSKQKQKVEQHKEGLVIF
jgi:hypothetical protein